MARKHLCLALSGVVLVALAVAGTANVVTVTADNLGGWSTLLIKGGSATPQAKFTDGGPAPAEGNPFPTANGAFYGYLTYNGDTQGTWDNVWLGLDTHNGQTLEGVPLKSITKLQYTAYNSGEYNVNWVKNDPIHPRHFPMQPFQVSLTVKCPTSSDRRQFIYRPWGRVGWATANLRRAWITNDAIAMTSDPNFSEGMAAAQWYEPVLKTQILSWDALISYDSGGGLPPYGEWTLVPTSTGWNPDPSRGELEWKDAGWTEPRATGTGKCINLEVGSRVGCPQYKPYSGSYEGANFKGYVDTFTLGINYGTQAEPNIVETTYDFASSNPYVPVVKKATMSEIGPCWLANPPYDFPYAKWTPLLNQNLFTFTWSGRVLDMTADSTGWETQFGPGKDPDTGEFYFTIWDGSYAPVSNALLGKWYANLGLVNVRLPYQECGDIIADDPSTYPVQVGDYVSVTGFQYSKFYLKVAPPLEISCSTANIANYSR